MNITKLWSPHYLSTKGQVLIVKTLVIPIMYYLLTVNEMPRRYLLIMKQKFQSRIPQTRSHPPKVTTKKGKDNNLPRTKTQEVVKTKTSVATRTSPWNLHHYQHMTSAKKNTVTAVVTTATPVTTSELATVTGVSPTSILEADRPGLMCLLDRHAPSYDHCRQETHHKEGDKAEDRGRESHEDEDCSRHPGRCLNVERATTCCYGSYPLQYRFPF